MSISESGCVGAGASVLGQTSNHIYIHFVGDLPVGDTLLLVHEDPVAPSTATGFALVPKPGVLPTVAASSAGPFQHCTPEPPAKEDGAHCSVPSENQATTEPESDCGASKYDCGANDESAEMVSAWGDGPPPCAPAGMETSVSICWEIEGNVEFGFEAELVEVSVGGSISYARCVTNTLQPCFCAGSWTCEWSQTQCWEICRDYIIWDSDIWWFRTVQYFSRKISKGSGSYAVQQTTTCAATGGGCGNGE